MAVRGACVVVVVALTLSWTVSAYDRVKLAQTPQVQPNFNTEKWMGTWYLQARLTSCLWKGSNDFDDWDLRQTLRPDGSILAVETWRSEFMPEVCTSMATILSNRPEGPGCYEVKDPIGDVLTGQQKVVATDYKTFSITRGCVKQSVVDEHICDDPWVTVIKRKVHPSAHTFKVVEAILQKLWNLSLAEMRRIKHTNPCHPPPSHGHTLKETPYY